MKFKNDIEAEASIVDASGSPGTANQLIVFDGNWYRLD